MTSPKALEEIYISVPEMAKETGVKAATAHSWLKYFRYMPTETIFGRPIVKRADFAKFKRDYPEVIEKGRKSRTQ